MKKKNIQKLIWVVISLIVTFTMVLWSIGAAYF